jgi:hypothetical protein
MRYLVLVLLLVSCKTVEVRRDPLAIPRSVPSQLGPVPVVVVDSILAVDSTLNLLGAWDPIRRVIYLKRALAPVQKLHTLYHEACHLWSFDAGIRQLVHPQIMQAVCDAAASARVMEILSNPGR